MSKKYGNIILGIETSCDETAAALVEYKGGKFNILVNVVFSQIDIHKKYGGIVPEVAARNHLMDIIPVISQTLSEAKINFKNISKIAVTNGPGLITSLIVGAQTAKTLAYVWQKPISGINHLKAHMYANWLSNKKIKFPSICLLVSGGHTELILVKAENKFKKIGQTLDDAAGEAFDKVAQMLEIGYPGGPIISELASKGNPLAFKFARPMINSNDFNFSFSGLKTSVLYTIKKISKQKMKKYQLKADICASFQQAAVEVLVNKTIKAVKATKARTVMLSGGVAANELLRQNIKKEAELLKIDFYVPPLPLCTDNAAMIAVAGFFEKEIVWNKLKVDPNLEI